MVSIERRAKAILVVSVGAVVSQLIGLAPGLQYLSGAFPTYFHKTESIVLLLILITSLAFVSFASGRILTTALVILGALMFYSGYKGIATIESVDPLHVRAIWAGVSFIVTVALAWVVIGAFQGKILGWREMFFSLVLSNGGFLYLNFISSLQG